MSTRPLFKHRAVVLGTDHSTFVKALQHVAQGNSVPGVITGTAALSGDRGREVVFVFPGQGSQSVGMAQGLLESAPVFSEAMRACAQALAPFVPWSLLEVLTDEAALQRVDVVQPVLWAMMVSLAALWRECGVRPAAVVGHSQGEIAAAVVAGALSLADGAKVVALRSQALARLSGHGAMVSVALAEAEVHRLLATTGIAGVSIAAVNGPSSVVVSGDHDGLQTLVNQWQAQQVWCRWLAVDYASHSAQMEPLREWLASALAPVHWRASQVPFYSTVTAERIDTAQLDTEYWFTNLRRMVNFQSAIENLLAHGYRGFIEVSPHPVLTGAMEDTAGNRQVAVLGSLRRDEPDADQFLLSVASAFVCGVKVDWTRIIARGTRVQLPTYAFDRQRYWLHSSITSNALSQAYEHHANHKTSNDYTLTQVLAGVADTARQHEIVREFLLSQMAHVLGHSSSAAVDPQTTLKELGFDSVAAVHLRSRLHIATGLRLPATLVFDHPTVAKLAEHLHCQLIKIDSGLNPSSEQVVSGSFANTVRNVFQRGDVGLAFEFCFSAARLRRETEREACSPHKLRATKIAEGSHPIALVCVPTFMAPAHVYQYSSFAEKIAGQHDVWFVPLAGYSDDEALPNDRSDVVNSLTESVVEAIGDQEFCLLGHSGGGVFAHAVAERLHVADVKPSAVVLVDTYFPRDQLSPELKAKLTAGMFNNEIPQELVGATQLTAMAHYLDMFESWRPTALHAIPCLFVRPDTALTPDEKAIRRTAAQLCTQEVIVRGDHFSMFSDHADITADTVNRWLRTRHSPQEPS